MMQDYYDILGVDENADQKAIKSAFRQKAKNLHPDSGGSEDAFKSLNEAYDTLKDEEKRAEYDFMRSGGINKVHIMNNVHSMHDIFNDGNININDLFHFFTEGYRTRKNRDLNITIELNIEDMLTEQKRTISVNDRTINITIPRGVKPGQSIIYKGLGEHADDNLPPGNLHVVIKTFPHPEFSISGRNLYTKHTINAINAMIGCKIHMNSIDKKEIIIDIPAGTQNNTVFSVPNFGLPDRQGRRGNMLVEIIVKIPKIIDNKLLNTLKKIKVEI